MREVHLAMHDCLRLSTTIAVRFCLKKRPCVWRTREVHLAMHDCLARVATEFGLENKMPLSLAYEKSAYARLATQFGCGSKIANVFCACDRCISQYVVA
jgi:hypothetical protein